MNNTLSATEAQSVPLPSSDEAPPLALYIALGPGQEVKIGTCEHCVVFECGRPERAWDALGESELDFDRDTLFAHLATLGIQITDRQSYICP